VLQCVAVWCDVSQCNAGSVIVSYDEVCEMQCVAACCSVLQCDAVSLSCVTVKHDEVCL